MHYCLSDYILELVQNAYDAQAKKIVLKITEGTALQVTVADTGCGMSAEQAQHALDPFYTAPGKHDKRRVGLGLPFVKQLAETTDGTFSLTSTVGVGTTVAFSVSLKNIDCPPLGDLIGGLVSLMAYPEPDTEFIVTREKNGHIYELKRSELIEALGGFETAIEMNLLRDFIKSQEKNIQED